MNTYYLYRHSSYSETKHKIEFPEIEIYKTETERDFSKNHWAIGKVTASEKYTYRKGRLIIKPSKTSIKSHLYAYALTFEDALKEKVLALINARKHAANNYEEIKTKLDSTIKSVDDFLVPIQTQYPELFL